MKNNKSSLVADLQDWTFQENISNSSLTKLAQILKKHGNDIPSDGRSILLTPRYTKCISMGSGKYFYLGVQTMLQQIESTDNVIELSINIDGASISNSSNIQLWPILGSLMNSKPFVIACFCGSSKPEINSFLDDLISELIVLENKVILKKVICDSPARSFVKCTKLHSGYSACDKCIVKGSHVGRVIFLERDSELRSDLSFRMQTDKPHHKGLSPFSSLKIDMILSFPYDYMHLVCLGVMRRLISFWLQGSRNIRLSHNIVEIISSNLTSFVSHVPSDFSRRPRPLFMFHHFKATEFRLFLLFTGVVVLKDNVSSSIYKNFLLLHSAIFILCDPILVQNLCNYAGEILDAFVESCMELYGPEMIVYNIHSLIHLASDCKYLGSLDSFSAFQYENKIKELKRFIHHGRLPLEQLYNRLIERKPVLTFKETFSTILKKPHTDGPVIDLFVNSEQYKVLLWNNTTLSVRTNDSFFMDKKRKVFKILNIISTNGANIKFICCKFKNLTSFYKYPFESSHIDIFVSSAPHTKLHEISLDRVYRKCFVLPYHDKFVIFPLFVI